MPPSYARRLLRATEAQAVLKDHLPAFVTRFPHETPPDRREGIDPIEAMGLCHGLPLASAKRCVVWLYETKQIDVYQASSVWCLITDTEAHLRRLPLYLFDYESGWAVRQWQAWRRAQGRQTKPGTSPSLHPPPGR